MLFAELEQDPWAAGKVVPTRWPAADVIIGNPLFSAPNASNPERSPDYVNGVRRTYPAVPGMADYCVYWFRKAHDHLPQCTRDDPIAGRAGLVGTQNIRNNKSREGGLDHIVQTGTIIGGSRQPTLVRRSQRHVSIVNGSKHRITSYYRNNAVCGTKSNRPKIAKKYAAAAPSLPTKTMNSPILMVRVSTPYSR